MSPTWRSILGSVAIIIVALLWIETDGIEYVTTDRDALIIVSELLVLGVIGFRAWSAISSRATRQRTPHRRGAIGSTTRGLAFAAAFAVVIRLIAYFSGRELSARYLIDVDLPPALRPILVFAIVVYFFWPELEVRLTRWKTP